MQSPTEIDYKTQYNLLYQKYTHLVEQVQDLRYHNTNLKKQIQIYTPLKSPAPELTEMSQQIDKLSHINLQQSQQLQNLRQKVKDLKYHNQEIRSLNEKMTKIHLKEIDMLEKQHSHQSNNSHDKKIISQLQNREKGLLKEKQTLQSKLEQCGKVVQQCQYYYQAQIKDLKDREDYLKHEINEITLKMDRMQYEYKTQIQQLQNTIVSLYNKLQGFHDQPTPKSSLQSSCSQVQSKMIQSSASIQSMRFNPNTSVSSCIKENLTRRNTSNAKTPSKFNQRMSGKFKGGALFERNHN